MLLRVQHLQGVQSILTSINIKSIVHMKMLLILSHSGRETCWDQSRSCSVTIDLAFQNNYGACTALDYDVPSIE